MSDMEDLEPMFAKVRAEAWDEGYDRGFYDREQLTGGSRDASEGASSNPYRTTEGEKP